MTTKARKKQLKDAQQSHRDRLIEMGYLTKRVIVCESELEKLEKFKKSLKYYRRG